MATNRNIDISMLPPHITSHDLPDWLIGAGGSVLGAGSHHIENHVNHVTGEVTLHHIHIAYLPFPNNMQRAYRVAYVSVPMIWLQTIPRFILEEMYATWNVTFEGPSGRIQNLPGALNDYAMLLGPSCYLGWDWSGNCETEELNSVRAGITSFLGKLNETYEEHKALALEPENNNGS